AAADGALFAYLEEETEDGRVLYATEGLLRFTHRAIAGGTAPYRTPAPYRSYLRSEGRPMPIGEVEPLVIDLLPVAYRSERGPRVRVALASADKAHFPAPPPPRFAVVRSTEHRSSLELPVQ